MKKKIIAGLIILILVFGVLFLKVFGVGFKKVKVEELKALDWQKKQKITNENYIKYKDEYDIIRNTDKLGGASKKYYSKYIDYIAPNGKPIRILAMDKISDEQLLYAYGLLSFYLKDNEKINKTEIANNMANNKAMLIMPNGADRDGKTPMAAMIGQNLNQMEIANIGSKWYTECDYEHRDASFEEIFHLVHDYGIGTTGNKGASEEISTAIKDALYNALPKDKKDWGKKGLWALGFGSQIDEWEKEGSLEQEYIVSVIDSYYGLWEAWNEGEGGMWDGYIAKTREDVLEKDPVGAKVLNQYLPDNIDYMMRIDPSFEGIFNMNYDEKFLYTTKSKYLKDLSLTGSKNSGILGNELDNILMGNSGSNTIDGGLGNDILQLKGLSTEYEIEQKSDKVIIKDLIENRDGTIIAKNIEILRFIDKDI